MYNRNSLKIAPWKQGLHWVGDLMLEADVEVESAAGELLLDLVEGGRHFTCAIDLTSGKATLSARVLRLRAESKDLARWPGRLPCRLCQCRRSIAVVD